MESCSENLMWVMAASVVIAVVFLILFPGDAPLTMAGTSALAGMIVGFGYKKRDLEHIMACAGAAVLTHVLVVTLLS